MSTALIVVPDQVVRGGCRGRTGAEAQQSVRSRAVLCCPARSLVLVARLIADREPPAMRTDSPHTFHRAPLTPNHQIHAARRRQRTKRSPRLQGRLKMAAALPPPPPPLPRRSSRCRCHNSVSSSRWQQATSSCARPRPWWPAPPPTSHTLSSRRSPACCGPTASSLRGRVCSRSHSRASPHSWRRSR
jgi:hypothetical protein